MKPINIYFLGTGSRMPTKERNPSSTIIEYSGEYIMFDCGEGTQKQMRILGLKPSRITKIFITHWHGDHTLGLGGMLQTLKADENKGIKIYGPKGTKKYIKHILNSFEGKTIVKHEVIEINEKKVSRGKGYSIKTTPLYHGDIKGFGYMFKEFDSRRIDKNKIKKLNLPSSRLLGDIQKGNKIKYEGKIISPEDVCKIEKGRKIAYVLDTSYNESYEKILEDIDVLIIESTFHSDEEDKAKEYDHMTSRDAGKIAQKAKIKNLILTHFSARYNDVSKLKKDAKEVFNGKVICAEDFMHLELKKSLRIK